MRVKRRRIPEKSSSDKVAYYKGEINALGKEIDNLAARIKDLEVKMDKLYTNPNKQDVSDNDKRIAILNKYNPDYRDDK